MHGSIRHVEGEDVYLYPGTSIISVVDAYEADCESVDPAEIQRVGIHVLIVLARPLAGSQR